MTFLHPVFLLGTLAAAVPVILHLIARRRALVHRFPAVRFLLLADKRTARKFRVHQWLLLALRVLAICLLALVLARPRLSGSGAQAAVAQPPEAVVLVLDNSLSMAYRDGQRSRWERAQALATQVLQGLRPQDRAAVVPLLPPPEATPPFFSSDRGTLMAQLAALTLRHEPVDVVPPLRQALALLRQSPVARRRLVLISDFTTQGWEDFHAGRLGTLPQGMVLHFLRIGGEQRDANVLVEDLQLHDAPLIAGAPLRATATVYNAGREPVHNLRLELLLAHEKVGEQLVDLTPEARVTVPFRFTAPAAGLHWGVVRLAGDRFSPDDQFFYALRTVTPARLLVVDGDPGTSLYDSEIFFLTSALQPLGALGQAAFYPKPVTWEGLAHERLADYQAVILCNVEALPPHVWQQLYQFVYEGGGLAFFAGNRVKPASYNAQLYQTATPLLPLPLGEAVQRPETAPLTIAAFDATHPLMRPFAGEEEILQRPRFYRYLRLEGWQAASDVRVILRLQDENPLLVEKRLGRGTVLFFATTADRDWTDLPTRTAYVPLMHGLASHLARLAAAAQRPGVLMPQPFVYAAPSVEAGTALTVITADGQRRLSRFRREGEQSVAEFAAYSVPGLYRLQTPEGPDLLPVNATRRESRFEKLQADDLQTRWRPLPVVLEDEAAFGRTAHQTLPAKELAGLLLVVLVAVLAVENVWSNRL